MKYNIAVLLFILFGTPVFAQKDSKNCTLLHQLLAKAKANTLLTESLESIPTDELPMWKAKTQLDGAKRCYVQDAFSYKLYVAEFNYAEGSKLDPVLSTQFNKMYTQLTDCFKNEFRSRLLNGDEYVLLGADMDGLGEYQHLKVNMYVLYNPADKKQTLVLSLSYDSGER
jgi:hypothetical protein